MDRKQTKRAKSIFPPPDAEPVLPRGEDAGPPAPPPPILDWARAEFSFFPDEAQTRVLQSEAARGILCCTRQWGKSTISALKALYRLVVQPKALVLVVSPSERQSREFLRKIVVFATDLGWKIKGDGSNRASVVSPAGGRIVALPANPATIRGFSSVSLVVIDEAAWVPEEMYRAIRPMLAVSNGDLWLMSTPFGQRGFFHDVWFHGGDRWDRHQVKGEDCPRISREFLAEELEALGDSWFRQEYCCEFLGGDSQWFERRAVENATDSGVHPLFGGHKP
jgi:hypothetical protein